MPSAKNDTVESAWLVRYDLLFIGHLSSRQCRFRLDHVVCEVFTIQGRVRNVENNQFCDCVIFDMDKRNVVCDVMSCANTLIGNLLYATIWLLTGTRSYVNLLAIRGRVRPWGGEVVCDLDRSIDSYGQFTGQDLMLSAFKE